MKKKVRNKKIKKGIKKIKQEGNKQIWNEISKETDK